MNDAIAPDWYADPFGRHERRYWDGHRWTEHVATHGHPSTDPATPSPPSPPISVDSQLPAGAAGAAGATRWPAAPGGVAGQWHADPFRRYEQRYWDGHRWTHHVATQGHRAVDPPVGTPVAAQVAASAPVVDPRIQRQAQRAGALGAPTAPTAPTRPATGASALFTEPVLVVNQKAKFFGADAEYLVHDQRGRRIGFVREVDQRLLRKALGGGGSNSSHRYQVVDDTGKAVISLFRPAKVWKSTLKVVGANGIQGQIAQKTVGVFGNVRFDLESGGEVIATMHAESHKAWDFNIQDPSGVEIARITKTWAGWAKERFTTADNYVVQIHEPLREPLRTLVIATALAVDTALKEGKPSSKASHSRSKRRYN